MRACLVLPAVLAVAPAAAQMKDGAWSPSTITIQDLSPKFLVFQSGIKIDIKTGQVTIPEGLSLDAASAEFWKGVEQMGVKLCQERK